MFIVRYPFLITLSRWNHAHDMRTNLGQFSQIMTFCLRLKGNIPSRVLNYQHGSVHCSTFNSLSNEIGIVSKPTKNLTQRFLPGETYCNYHKAHLRFIDLEIGKHS